MLKALPTPTPTPTPTPMPMTQKQWQETQQDLDVVIDLASKRLGYVLWRAEKGEEPLTDDQRQHVAATYSLLKDIDDMRVSLALDRMSLCHMDQAA